MANAPARPKYVVCNADESEPGTFKDRVLMEEDPHRIIEGMIIAAYAVGASRVTFTCAASIRTPSSVLSEALAEARQAGCLGENIFGRGLGLRYRNAPGAGAYICGEETALFNPSKASEV